MAEFNDVAGREKFRPYLTEEEKDGFIELLYRESHLVQVSETVEACRDPDDNKFLELAVTVNAQVIVTGDQDLGVLDPFRGIRIIPPGRFVTQFPPLP